MRWDADRALRIRESGPIFRAWEAGPSKPRVAGSTPAGRASLRSLVIACEIRRAYPSAPKFERRQRTKVGRAYEGRERGRKWKRPRERPSGLHGCGGPQHALSGVSLNGGGTCRGKLRNGFLGSNPCPSQLIRKTVYALLEREFDAKPFRDSSVRLLLRPATRLGRPTSDLDSEAIHFMYYNSMTTLRSTSEASNSSNALIGRGVASKRSIGAIRPLPKTKKSSGPRLATSRPASSRTVANTAT
jgi:hypothetical protein